MTERNGAELPGQGQQSFNNTAGGNSKVGAQFGFVAGNANIYYTSKDQSPEEKYDVAIHFLKASAGSRAKDLIRESVEAGIASNGQVPPNEIAYYWILAVLSGRSFEQLGPDDFEAFDLAKATIRRSGSEQKWLVPLDIVCQLVDCLQRQDQAAGSDLVFGQLLDDYQALSPEFQEDFQRHLDLMLASGIEDHVETIIAEQARQLRMSNERTARAWKYFEQYPAPPRTHMVARPDFPFADRLLASFAGLLVLAGAGLAMYVLEQGGALRAILVSALGVIGAATAAFSRISYLAATERLADKEREFGRPHFSRYSSPPPASENDNLPDDAVDEDEANKARQARGRRVRFARMLSDHINEQFIKRSPRSPTSRRKWATETAKLNDTLMNEILDQYRGQELPAGALNWLATWRVREIARMWREGTLYDYQRQMSPGARDTLGFIAGLTVSACVTVYASVVMIILQPILAVIAIIVLVTAGLLGALSKLDIFLVKLRRLKADKVEASLRDAAEEAEYQRWVDELMGRPTDDEMARWLDFDKIHLRKLTMNQLGLPSRDILSHATLTEPAPGCILARLPYGPPRYSVYLVTVFLLTKAGVRQVTVTLDFRTGNFYNQMRRSFRYDVIRSANVREIGVRYDSGRRQAMPRESPWAPERNSASNIAPQGDVRRNVDGSIILWQDFRLSLGDGEGFGFLVENNFDARFDLDEEDALGLLDLALDTSGISAALEILEAISGHGAQWVSQRLGQRRH